MPIAALTTLDALVEHFDKGEYRETLLTCANKRTDRPSLLAIYNRFFSSERDTEVISDIISNGMSVEDLGQVMQYKLSRGKWRPRLQQLIESNDESDVKRITLSALPETGDGDVETLSIPDLQEKITSLCVLKAVGPATASLILSIFHDSVPFFSDEFAAFYPTKDSAKLKYTLKEYTELVERHWSWLDEQQERKKGGSGRLTSRDVEEMIWYWRKTPTTSSSTTNKLSSSSKRVADVDNAASGAKRTRRA